MNNELPVAENAPETIEAKTIEAAVETDSERFLLLHSEGEAGDRLWRQWYGRATAAGQAMLDHLATQWAEANQTDLETARRRLAAEKFLQDRGGDEYAAKFMEGQRARAFQEGRSLQPMQLHSKAGLVRKKRK